MYVSRADPAFLMKKTLNKRDTSQMCVCGGVGWGVLGEWVGWSWWWSGHLGPPRSAPMYYYYYYNIYIYIYIYIYIQNLLTTTQRSTPYKRSVHHIPARDNLSGPLSLLYTKVFGDRHQLPGVGQFMPNYTLDWSGQVRSGQIRSDQSV